MPWCTAAAGAAAGVLGSIIVQKIRNPHADINWKQVTAAGIGGAVAGGTLGLMTAPAAATTLTETVILSTAGTGEIATAGATAGIVGGAAERAFENNGDPEKTIGTPGQIATDAGLGAAGAVVGHAVGSIVPKLTGAHEAAENAAAQAAKHPALSGSALARRTAASAAGAAAAVAGQETAGEVAGYAAVEAVGQALKKKDKD